MILIKGVMEMGYSLIICILCKKISECNYIKMRRLSF